MSQQNRNQIMLSSWSPWPLWSWIILASVSLTFTMVPCDLLQFLQHKPVSHLRDFASTVPPVCTPLPPWLPFIIQVSAQMSPPQNWSPVTQTKHTPSYYSHQSLKFIYIFLISTNLLYWNTFHKSRDALRTGPGTYRFSIITCWMNECS